MIKFYSLMILLATIIYMIRAYNTTTQNSDKLVAIQTAHISPEILNELKDFENLIPTATIDEIVAKHYVIDGNFRRALKYLRSQEFNQLQKQLLNIPEIIDILDFLHLTTTNATTRRTGATEMPTTAGIKSTLDEYNDNAVAGSRNTNDKMTTNNGINMPKPYTLTIEDLNEAHKMKKIPKRPQQQYRPKGDETNKNPGIDDDDDAVNANRFVRLSNEQQPLVDIVLLEDLKVRSYVHNEVHGKRHHHKYHRQRNTIDHFHDSVGTFTEFVVEVLQHLPHTAYQNMIKDKCKKNLKFAEFYQALRSPELKSVIEQAKSTDSIKKIIQTLGSHDVDINALEPIAFEVISWGPVI